MHKTRLKNNRESIQPVLADLKKGLMALYGARLKKIILFGSYARGEATENSDIDILVLLKNKPMSRLQEIKRMGDIIFDLLIQHHQLVGIVAVGEQEWKDSASPLYRAVKKEGVTL